MTWEHVKTAVKPSGLDIYSRMVLIDLAWLADRHGACFPRIAWLARHPGISESKVRQSLAVLKAADLIVIRPQTDPVTGRQKPNSYVVTLSALAAAQEASKKRGQGAPRTGVRVHHVEGEGTGHGGSPPPPRAPLETKSNSNQGGADKSQGHRDEDVASSERERPTPANDAAKLTLLPGGRAA